MNSRVIAIFATLILCLLLLQSPSAMTTANHRTNTAWQFVEIEATTDIPVCLILM